VFQRPAEEERVGGRGGRDEEEKKEGIKHGNIKIGK